MNSIKEDLLSVMIRCDADDLAALDRGLFHLFSQQYRPIEVVVVISASLGTDFLAGVKDLHSRWAPFFFRYEVLQEFKGDLLNLAHVIQRCHGRYLTIFNLMNKVYPHFYQTAISNIQKETHFGWAYCDVVMAHCDPKGIIKKRWTPFLRTKYSFLDNLAFDFVPLDSVLVDRTRTPEIDKFQTHFFSSDPHEILLKIACMYQPLYLCFVGVEITLISNEKETNIDFSEVLIKKFGKPNLKNRSIIWDANTFSSGAVSKSEFLVVDFSRKLTEYEMRIFPGKFRYRAQLSEQYESLSWRVSRPFRNLVNLIKGAPKLSKDEIPDTEEAALEQLIALFNSTSWWVTYPIRLFLGR